METTLGSGDFLDGLCGIVVINFFSVVLGVHFARSIVKDITNNIVDVNKSGRFYKLIYPKISGCVFDRLHGLRGAILLLLFAR